ncbi:MAG: FAD-dependent oxidoreductase [Myxococcales bacterium]|nr:FAD-dependent oxidoreductase [Myxococcales bacterium]USN51677.1 MAG: FAD-dependent oxidoreductase [Myxococcales bacterium]
MKYFSVLKTFVFFIAILLIGHATHATRFAIVGAGLSGVTAKYLLAKRGFRAQLFEASDRLGGRVYTHKDYQWGIEVEGGGSFIDRGHRNIIQLAQELGLSLLELKKEGAQQRKYFFNNRLIDYKQLYRESLPILREIHYDLATIKNEKKYFFTGITKKEQELDQLSIRTYLTKLGASPLFLELANATQCNENGRDIDDLNALCFLQLIKIDFEKEYFLMDGQLGDEGSQIEGGNSRIIEALAQTIPKSQLFFHHRLKKILRHAQGFQLQFDVQGQEKNFDADKVIMALPMPILREDVDLSQEGLLPKELSKLINDLPYAMTYKMVLVFSKPIWRTQDDGMLELMTKDFDLWESSFNNSANKNFHLTAYFGGQRALEDNDGNEKVEKVLSVLEKLYPDIRNYFLGTSPTIHWPTHSLSKGAYAGPAHVGQWQQLELLDKAKAKDIYFVGEQWGDTNSLGFMDTAVHSAHRAVQEIILETYAHEKSQ